MNEKPVLIHEKIAALTKAKKNLQIFSILLVVCGIAVIFLLSLKPAAGLVLTLALVVIYLLLFRKQAKDYRQAVKQAMLEEGLRPFLKNITYERKDGVSPETILSPHFLPSETPKNLLVRDTVQGTYQTMKAFLTDVTTDYLSYKDGGKQVTDFLSGCLFDVSLPHGSHANFLLWSKKIMPEKSCAHYFSHMQQRTAPGSLAKDFILYTYTTDAPFELSEESEKTIQRLSEYTPGHVCLQVLDGHLRIFISNRFLFTLHIPGQVEITSKILNTNPFLELPYMLRIVDTLNQ